MSNRVLFIGLTTIDIQHFVDKFPKSNTKVKGEYPLINVGGPAANAAITASFLGLDVDFLSIVGENTFTSFIYNEFEKYNVSLIDALHGHDFNPIFASVITEVENSNRTILTHHPELKTHDYSSIINQVQQNNYDIIFIDGFYPELAIPILKKAKNCPTIFDGGSWKNHLDPMLNFIDIAICSDNFRPPHTKNHSEVFEFLTKHKIQHKVITRGNLPVLYQHSNSSTTEIAVEKVNAIDTLAAGDIFHGSFVYRFTQNSNIEYCIRKASEIASLSTTVKGPRDWMKLLEYKEKIDQ